MQGGAPRGKKSRFDRFNRFRKKPSSGSNLGLSEPGNVLPNYPSPMGDQGEPEEPSGEPGEGQGGDESGGEQQPSEQGNRKDKLDEKQKRDKKPETPKPSTSDAAKNAAKQGAEKEAAAGGLAKLAGTLAGPWGKVIAFALPIIKKYWKPIVIGILIFIFGILIILLMNFYQREYAGATSKKALNVLTPDPDILKERVLGKKVNVEGLAKQASSSQSDAITAIKKMLDQENAEVRGTSQKAKILSLFDQYSQKIEALKKLVLEIQAKELNIKPEEKLTKEDFEKRNSLESQIDSTYLESKTILENITKELNKCDKISSGEPNNIGFYHLQDNGSFNRYVSVAGNENYDPYYGKGMLICYINTLAQKWLAQTGQKLEVGEMSLANAGSMMNFGLGSGHLDGLTVVITGSEIVKDSKVIFGVDYKSAQAKKFEALAKELGGNQVIEEKDHWSISLVETGK